MHGNPREPTGTNTIVREIMSIAWVIGLQNSSDDFKAGYLTLNHAKKRKSLKKEVENKRDPSKEAELDVPMKSLKKRGGPARKSLKKRGGPARKSLKKRSGPAKKSLKKRAGPANQRIPANNSLNKRSGPAKKRKLEEPMKENNKDNSSAAKRRTKAEGACIPPSY